jgi:peroxiredoxin
MRRFIILICVLSVVFLAGMSQPPAGKNMGFKLQNLQGQEQALDSFKGTAVLITFFTVWCPSCQDDMPKLETLYEKYHDQNFVVVGINIKDSPDEVKQFAKDYGIKFNLLLDENGDVARAYKVRYIPRSFLYDKNGALKFSDQYVQPEDLEAEILKILK